MNFSDTNVYCVLLLATCCITTTRAFLIFLTINASWINIGLSVHATSFAVSQAAQCCWCKAHAKIDRRMGNSTPCKIVTPENLILKLCTRDYVGEIIHHANLGFNQYSGGFSPNSRNTSTLWLFRLSLPFFSITRPGRTAGPVFTLYGSNVVFPLK